jgi:tetrapyrrole methylase family protein/MazG family protein
MKSEGFPKEGLDTFEALLQIIERLRSPTGCPWDREQTHRSLKRNLLEECYEVLEAIDSGDAKRLSEELGDILVQVAFHAQIAREAGEFTIRDVLRQVNQKLIHRHPHVFGDVKVADAREVERNWERLRGRERGSLLEGLPLGMPALALSQLMQDRAARAGFDWESLPGVLEKVAEEIRELKEGRTQEEKAREIGDLLFALVNAARWMGIHAEDALRQANERFHRRFTTMERLCRERGLNFADLPMEQKEALWQEAKGLEGA